jgi:hypothetical protein
MSDQVSRVQYFTAASDYITGVKKYFDAKGNPIGEDDPVKQECIQYAAETPTPTPEPKSSPSLLRRALAYFVTGTSRTSRCGDISEACQDKRPRNAWIEPPTDNYDYSNPKTVTYKIHGIANCDWTLEGIEVTAYFGSEKKTATFEKGVTLEGHETLTAVFQHQFITKIQGRIPVFIKGANGNIREIDLYPPLPKDTATSKTQCEYANNAPSGSISITSPSLTSTGLIPFGSDMTVYVSAYDCDGVNNGDKLSALLQPFANTYLKMTDKGIVGGRRVFSRPIKAENLAKPLCAKISDEAQSTSIEVCTSDFTIVPASSSSSPQPLVGISAPYSAKVNIPVNISAQNPDSKIYDYNWKFSDGGKATGSSISHTFTSIGTSTIELTVSLKLDPTVKKSATQPISIGTTAVPMPAITAVHNPATGPGSGYNINFNAAGSYSPIGATITNYKIEYGDGTSENNSTGIFSHTYPNPGAGNTSSRKVMLTITDSNNQTNWIDITVSIWGD